MTDAHRRVLARSLYLWIAAAAVIGFNTAAAIVRDERLVIPALALTGVLAIIGIGFGIWAGMAMRSTRD